MFSVVVFFFVCLEVSTLPTLSAWRSFSGEDSELYTTVVAACAFVELFHRCTAALKYKVTWASMLRVSKQTYKWSGACKQNRHRGSLCFLGLRKIDS